MYDLPKLNKGKNRQQKALLTASKKGYRIMRNGDVYSYLGNKLSLIQDNRGYLVFTIGSGNKATKVSVHRLQAFQKYGYNLLENGIQVRHLNGNKKDNSYSNIAIGTRSDNMMDISKDIRIKNAKNQSRKLSDEEYKEIKERINNRDYSTYQKLADEYGLKSKGSIYYIRNKMEV